MGISIKKGDMVEITAGKQKGKTGKVLKVLRDRNLVLIEKLNLVKRHTRPTQKVPQGGIVEKEAGIDVSNIAIFNPKSEKADKVGVLVQADGKKARIFKSDQSLID